MSNFLLPRLGRFAVKEKGSMGASGLLLAAIVLLCTTWPLPCAGADKLEAIKPVGEPVRHPDGETQRVIVSPDGKTVAVLGHKGRAFLWDAAKQAKLYDLPEHRMPLEFSEDGKLLWMGWCGESLPGGKRGSQLWDVAKGEAAGEVCEKLGSTTPTGLSPDVRTIGIFDRIRCNVQLSDTATGKPLGDPIAQPTAVMGLMFDDGAYSTSPTYYERHDHHGDHMLFSPDGKTLLTQNLAKDQGADLYLWDVASGKRIAQLDVPRGKIHPRGFMCCFSPDGQTLATLGAVVSKPLPGGRGTRLETTEVTFFEMPTGKRKGSIKMEADTSQYLFTFGPDGKSVLTQRHPPGADAELVLYEVETGKPLQRFVLDEAATGGPYGADEKPWGGAHTAAFANNGQTLIVVCKWHRNRASKKALPEETKDRYGHCVIVLDVETGKIVAAPLRFANFVTQVVACPDGKTFWTATGQTPHPTLRIIDYKQVEAQQWQLPDRKSKVGETGKEKPTSKPDNYGKDS
jgi:WD40 repeat protein